MSYAAQAGRQSVSQSVRGASNQATRRLLILGPSPRITTGRQELSWGNLPPREGKKNTTTTTTITPLQKKKSTPNRGEAKQVDKSEPASGDVT